MKKFLVFILTFVVALTFLVIFQNNIRDSARNFILKQKKNNLPPELTYSQSPLPTLTTTVPSGTVKSFKGVNLAVPFSPQAPFGDWSLPYQEACEEISAILVHKYYMQKLLTPEMAKNEILKLVDWQKNRFSHYQHTTAQETATILREYYGYKRVDVLSGTTIDNIKSHILAGRPVIVPLAGRMLDNSYYKQPGPIYHMLVVKGITKNGDFITNDVGTKRGQNYVYDDELLFNAVHDAPEGGDGWLVANPEEYIKTGSKTIIVVYPN